LGWACTLLTALRAKYVAAEGKHLSAHRPPIVHLSSNNKLENDEMVAASQNIEVPRRRKEGGDLGILAYRSPGTKTSNEFLVGGKTHCSSRKLGVL